MAESPQSGGNSYFLWEKEEEGVCSSGRWGKKIYFKINTFLLVFLSSDSMWLGMSGNVILCHDQNNPLKHFFFSLLNATLYSVWSNLVLWGITGWQQRVKAQTNTHSLCRVLPVVPPQLKSGVEGAVVAHQSDQYRWETGLGTSVIWGYYSLPGCPGWILLLSIFLIFPWSSSASVPSGPFIYFFFTCNPGFLCFRGGWGSRAPQWRLFCQTPKESLSSSTSLTLQVIVQSWKSCSGKHLALFCTFYFWFQPNPEPSAEFIPVKSLPAVLTHIPPGWFGVKGP